MAFASMELAYTTTIRVNATGKFQGISMVKFYLSGLLKKPIHHILICVLILEIDTEFLKWWMLATHCGWSEDDGPFETIKLTKGTQNAPLPTI
jgi:hypothetical protein